MATVEGELEGTFREVLAGNSVSRFLSRFVATFALPVNPQTALRGSPISESRKCRLHGSTMQFPRTPGDSPNSARQRMAAFTRGLYLPFYAESGSFSGGNNFHQDPPLPHFSAPRGVGILGRYFNPAHYFFVFASDPSSYCFPSFAQDFPSTSPPHPPTSRPSHVPVTPHMECPVLKVFSLFTPERSES